MVNSWKRTAGAVASGLMLTAAFPKIGIDYLAWVALVPLVAAVDGVPLKMAFRTGFLFGLAHFMTLLYWVVPTMTTYGHLPFILAFPILFLFAAVLGLFPSLFAVALAKTSVRPVLMAPAVPVFWTAQELLRARLFTGFPWELLGYSQFQRLELIQIAEGAGVYGVSFLIALVNGAVYLLWRAAVQARPGPRAERKRAAVVVAASTLLVVGAWIYGTVRIPAVDAAAAASETVRVALVQGNIPQEIKWDANFQRRTTLKYARLSEAGQASNPDLIVWPETATPFYFPFHRDLSRIVFDAVKKAEADFLIGSPSFKENKGETVYFNSAYLLSSDGAVADRYDKVHLVPFGEYVPFKRYLPFLGKIVEHVGDFQSGAAGKTLKWQGHRLGVLICYESIFPSLSRAQAAAGADLLINITNDAWYGFSSAPWQHFSMAVFRSVENRRSLVRAANTGITGFIDPVGRVAEATSLFEDAVVTRPVSLVSEDTLYTRVGDLFAWLCLGAAVVLFWVGLRSEKKPIP